MNNMINKYYIFDRLELHGWLTESINFSKTYIKITKKHGLTFKPIGLNITREKKNGYTTIISGILRGDDTIFDLYRQKINSKEYNEQKEKILKCIHDDFIFRNVKNIDYAQGLWWENYKWYRIPNLIFDTVMQ